MRSPRKGIHIDVYLEEESVSIKSVRGQNPAPGLEPVGTPHQSHIAEKMTAPKQTQ